MLITTTILLVVIVLVALLVKEEDNRNPIILGIVGALFLIYTHVGVYKLGVSVEKDRLQNGVESTEK